MSMYIFIVNPISGNGKSQKIWAKIKTELDARDVEYRTFFTKYQGHAEEITRQVAKIHHEKLTAIVSVGGDGTLHEVLNGLEFHPNIPVGCIPTGSGNDARRGFGIPKTPLKALKRILNKRPRAIKAYDMGEYQFERRQKSKGLFINGLGIGFDGEVAKLTNESRYKLWLSRLRLGSLAYVISAMRLIFKYKPNDMNVMIDGVTHKYKNVWLVAISNIPYYGGGMKITPGAVPTDGRLNLCIVHNLNPWKLFFVLGTVFLGWHTKLKEVSMQEGTLIHVHSNETRIVHADGEIIGETDLWVTVHMKNRKLC